jgi:hypothetical protein
MSLEDNMLIMQHLIRYWVKFEKTTLLNEINKFINLL